MTINSIQVQAYELLNVERLDNIRVILHDIRPGEGRAIIECFGKSWSSYWGGMGNRSILQFISDCEADYIASAMNGTEGSRAKRAYFLRIVKAVQEFARELIKTTAPA